MQSLSQLIMRRKTSKMKEQELEFKVEFAEIKIEAKAVYPYLKQFCKDYVIDTKEIADFKVEMTPEELQKEKEKDKETAVSGSSEAYLETLAFLRRICDEMAEYQCFLMHGAVIEWNKKAYVFTAPSGTGKSTHIALWRKYLGEGVQVINGDKPFLRMKSNQIWACGSPWAGKEGWQNNKSGILNGICVLEQAKENQIQRLSAMEALPYLVNQIHFTEEAEKAGKLLDLLDKLLLQIPVYLLKCNISEEAVRCSFEALSGENYKENSK